MDESMRESVEAMADEEVSGSVGNGEAMTG